MYLEKAKKWKEFTGLDPVLREELEQMDDHHLREAFTDDIAFGTGGLRGILGVGTSRINYYTVRKATLGFGRYLESFENAHEKGVVIAHDNRRYSKEFALDNSLNNIRIDTHKNNIDMKKMLTRHGFSMCGVIKLRNKNNDLRDAYQLVIKNGKNC